MKNANPKKAQAKGDIPATIFNLLIAAEPQLLWHENKAGITPIDIAVGKTQILKYLLDIAYFGRKERTDLTIDIQNFNRNSKRCLKK